MRPQHLAADNTTQIAGSVQNLIASMRPQHLAADNITIVIVGEYTTIAASMRPQHLAADNRHSVNSTEKK